MGGRGTFASGNPVPYTYETVDKIDGVKVLRPMDSSKALKLPEEAHSSPSYILLDKDGVFHQYREYNENHEITLEIGYHHEPELGKGDVLHIHILGKPGIDYHNDPTTIKRKLTRAEYAQYKSFFKGVHINERQYFS
ncbi:MAG: hypothetical protein IKH09_06705 [Clostridia bacterium]|nr:hypothetical protein [Clostridia bacterium]